MLDLNLMMNKVLTNCGHSSWQYNRPITYPITDISDHLTQFVPTPGDWHTELSSQDIYRRNYKEGIINLLKLEGIINLLKIGFSS